MLSKAEIEVLMEMTPTQGLTPSLESGRRILNELCEQAILAIELQAKLESANNQAAIWERIAEKYIEKDNDKDDKLDEIERWCADYKYGENESEDRAIKWSQESILQILKGAHNEVL